MSKKLNILFLSPRFSYPLIGGDRVKPYNILKHLSKNHNVTLITFYQGSNCPKEYINEMTSLGLKIKIIELDPIHQGLRAGALTLAGYPLEIGYYNNPNYSIMVDKVIQDEKFDLAFAFFMRTAEYLKNKDIPKILMAEDCRIIYQQRSYKESKNIIQKFVRWWEYNKLLKYEPAIINNFDITTFVTNNDIESERKFNSKANYKLLSNGVDIDLYKLPEDNSSRKDILFAGKLDIWANVLMITQIVEKILPIVWKVFPNLKFNIVGSNPPKNIRKFQSDKINVISNVPSMVPYYQSALIFLHPHSGGTGIQNKLLEAMACGCSVLTTQTGIQGIDVIDNESVVLANNPKEFAEKLIFLLKNQEKAIEIGIASNKVIFDTHSWEAIYKSLDEIMEELLNKKRG